MTHPEPPLAGDETATLLGSLGGLLKHLALVEDDYATRRLFGQELGPPWDTVDRDADPGWEWRTAADDTPEQLMSLWLEAVARSRSASTRRWPMAAWIIWPPGSATPAVHRPTCGGCWSI